MQNILLHRFSDVRLEALNLLLAPLREAFGLPVLMAQEPITLTERGHYQEREQWLARQLLSQVAVAPAPSFMPDTTTAARLGVTAQDLFATGLNFVFGEASSQHHCAVMSLARLDDAFYGLPPSSPEAFSARCVTEAVHELGHAFGLPHCRWRDCVMWFSNTLEETDAKGWRFCGECGRRVAAAKGRGEQ